ncbi:MAG: tRNA pseudouridine(55) synthase TruB [Spirulinaceae cyanobacterium SM2_1_0]|nr:tRNA pseudouridine(55) synthase TruB [Spirulinaceae cyanobacterium SM2_1_0]
MLGFLNLNKPAGLTSHDCVARVRRCLRLKRVGHGGTLDPAATGVLPIALGKATRLLNYLPEAKAYRALVRFGVQTSTDDLEGEILRQTPAPDLTLPQVAAVLPAFCGLITQIPPAYSAIQRDGKRLYELARAGIAVDVPARMVTVSAIEILGWQPGAFPELELAIACGSGTYIRAIARDLGDHLQVGATLAALTRTASCGLTLNHSLSLEDFTAQVEIDTWQPLPPAALLGHLPSVALTTALAYRWCLGQRLAEAPPAVGADTASVRVETEAGDFLGIGHYVAGCLGAKVAIASPERFRS